VIDLTDNHILIQEHAFDRIAPASLTKLMTAIVALETEPRPDPIVVNLAAAQLQPTEMGFYAGEEFSFDTLLQATLIESANDAAYALAESCGPGVDTFVERMNAKAKVLGLTNTHFTNPHGLDDPDHYSTLVDIARLSEAAINNPTIAQIVATPTLSVATTDQTHWFNLETTNPLLGKRDDIKGIKTGYTQNAGLAISLLVELPDRQLLIVIFGSSDRGADGETLISYITRHLHTISLPTLQSSFTIRNIFLGYDLSHFIDWQSHSIATVL
jgi:D-alanyl-D-alanine carboxypeptidase